MATLRQKYDITQDTRFTQRVRLGACVVAFEVLQEPEGAVGHAQRFSLARAVLADPTIIDVRMSTAIITDDATFDSQIDTTSSPPSVRANQAADNALMDRLRAVWSLLSGVVT